MKHNSFFKLNPFIICILLLSLSGLQAQDQDFEKVRFYYLGGQSNMDGFGTEIC